MRFCVSAVLACIAIFMGVRASAQTTYYYGPPFTIGEYYYPGPSPVYDTIAAAENGWINCAGMPHERVTHAVGFA